MLGMLISATALQSFTLGACEVLGKGSSDRALSCFRSVLAGIIATSPEMQPERPFWSAMRHDPSGRS